MKQDIIFQNSKEDHLQGILIDPSGDTSKLMVIMIHGFSSSKNTPNFITIADFLTEKGIASFRFDIYGHGESDGNLEDITVSEAVDDAKEAINYIMDKGYTNVALLGSSFGGLTSIIAASQMPDLKFLILKSPVSNYEEKEKTTKPPAELKEWKRTGQMMYEKSDGSETHIHYSFYEDFKNNDGYTFAPSIHIPTLIVHGENDEVVPVAQSIKTSKLIPDCKLIIVKSADHRYSKSAHQEQMLDAIKKFIVDHADNE